MNRPAAGSVERRFLGWDAPLLPRVVASLRELARPEASWQLGHLTCVLPTASARNRLEQLLADAAKQSASDCTPPALITIGELAERLYQPSLPIASEFEQSLAWTRAMRQLGANDLAEIVPSTPDQESIGSWLELAGATRRLHEEVASADLDFREVLDQCESEPERRRWEALVRWQKLYVDELATARLADPQVEQLRAIEADCCETSSTIILVGTADFSPRLGRMIRQVPTHVISLIAAPPDQAQRFDALGSVLSAEWLHCHLPITDEHLVAAAGIDDQAAAVAEMVTEFSEHYRADEIVVGVTDESHVEPLELELQGCSFNTARHLGWTIAQTSVGRLLSLVAEHLRQSTWQSLAAVVRHAEVRRYLDAQLPGTPGWLDDLDDLLSNHFPVLIDDRLPEHVVKSDRAASEVRDQIHRWLAVFDVAEQSLASWSEQISRWLGTLYGDDHERSASEESRSPRTAAALATTRRLLSRFAKLNSQLDLGVNGAGAIEIISARLAEARIATQANTDALNIVGWLDLALDDAPAIVVNGFNHPFVPAAVSASPFLPRRLRIQLRSTEDDRRFARDAYVLQLLLSSRPCTRLIVGRRSGDGTPTPPSRLLAAAPSEDAARRVVKVLDEPRSPKTVAHAWDDGPALTELPIPTFDSSLAPSVLSVTAFRDYLKCPYRFYLRHVLKLRPIDDSASELAANQFGDLVHGALESFGLSSERDESRVEKIEALLIEHLHAYADERYGPSAASAVQLQVQQAERRLKVVAARQAERIGQGWLIHAVEAAVDEKATDGDGNPKPAAGIEVDGEVTGLRGRFDRIDHHPQSGRWAILDYKTHGEKPAKKHLRKVDGQDEWIDLQLPLYRLMIPFLGIDADPDDVEVGYFNISDKDSETQINLADFTPAELEQAEFQIRECIRGIRAGKFEPTEDLVPYDDYATILQVGVPQRLLDVIETDSGSGGER